MGTPPRGQSRRRQSSANNIRMHTGDQAHAHELFTTTRLFPQSLPTSANRPLSARWCPRSQWRLVPPQADAAGRSPRACRHRRWTVTATSTLNELAMRRRTRRLWRIGPLELANLLARIETDHPGADVVDLRQRRELHLAPAARQARRAA